MEHDLNKKDDDIIDLKREVDDLKCQITSLKIDAQEEELLRRTTQEIWDKIAQLFNKGYLLNIHRLHNKLLLKLNNLQKYNLWHNNMQENLLHWHSCHMKTHCNMEVQHTHKCYKE